MISKDGNIQPILEKLKRRGELQSIISKKGNIQPILDLKRRGERKPVIYKHILIFLSLESSGSFLSGSFLIPKCYSFSCFGNQYS
jgi:hypothetical protein